MRSFSRILALVVFTTVLVAPVGVASAQEEATVSFVGSGWGHGVGLSQYGAYGASREGWTVEQILEHYYQGATLGTIGENGLAERENIWVNLEKDRSSILLVARETNLAPAEPVVLTRGEDSWELGTNHRLQITWNPSAGTCGLEIQDSSGAVIESPGDGVCNADIAWDGSADKPSRKIEIDGCYQRDWNSGTDEPCEYARGELHLRVGPGGMDLSVELDIDDYILGISEMPYWWGLSSNGGYEALKAQAVAARSYARELQIYRNPPGDNGCAAWCDVRDTTIDQRYVGWGHVGSGIDEWIDAVKSTAGQVLTHPDAPNGTVVRAYYSSSSGGATENVHEVWSSFSNPVPYLTSVDDSWAKTSINPHASWTVTENASSVAASVGLDTLTGAAVTERHSSGSVKEVVFTGLKNGVATTVEKSGSWVDGTMGLRSIYFSVAYGEVEVAPFDDISGSVHYADIVYISDLDITKGCNPPSNTNFCPNGQVTRGEMAAFIARSLGLTDEGGTDWFSDDDGSIFESDINKLRAAEITSGCNGDGTRFCPDDVLTRGEMAAFLVRGFGYTDPGAGDWFVDDDESIFEGNIDRLKAAGVTVGCNPPTNDRFCPDDPVERDQMASFLARALLGLGA